MHFRQKKICGSPRAKQNQQKAVLCCKAPRHADQEGKGEIFLFYCLYLFFGKVWLGWNFKTQEQFLLTLCFLLLLVWRGFSTKPEVLRDDPRLQRNLGNNPFINYWPCKFGLKNRVPYVKLYAGVLLLSPYLQHILCFYRLNLTGFVCVFASGPLTSKVY